MTQTFLSGACIRSLDLRRTNEQLVLALVYASEVLLYAIEEYLRRRAAEEYLRRRAGAPAPFFNLFHQHVERWVTLV